MRTALGDWNNPKAAMARVEAKRARRRRRQATEARALAGGRS